jgi:hypothetical protein
MVDVEEIEEDFEKMTYEDDEVEEDSGETEEDFLIDDGIEEAGIFDEDFESLYDEDPGSDFDIGSTMLASSEAVESWSGQNLEDTISRERVEKDWGDSEEFAAGDFYKSSEGGSDAYMSGSDAYSTGRERGEGLYGATGSDAYDAEKEGSYSSNPGDVGSLKSHDRLKDEHRGSRSMLEIAGFEDKTRQKSKDFSRDFVAYEAKDAA